MTIGEILRALAPTLPGETPLLDAQALVAHALGKPRTWVLAHANDELTPSQLDALENTANRVRKGEPLPYVFGHWEFYGLDFIVTPDVLIPRPETELLVEKAREWLDRHPEFDRALDVGTGSGCIPVALAHSTPRLSLVATDVSAPALEVARQNAARNGVDGRIQFIQCDLLPDDGLPPTVHLVTANLPYIPSYKVPGLEIYGKEPTLALDGGEDGLVLIRRLLTLVPRYLVSGGMILLEIEAGQGNSALSLAGEFYKNAKISLYKDYSGNERLIEIQT